MKNTKFKKQRKESNENDIEETYENETEPTKWYTEIADDPKNVGTVTVQVLIELKEEAKKCHASEVANYSIKNSKGNSDYRWMKTATSKGTVSDRIAAKTMLILNNPVANLEMLSTLISTVKIGKKNECITTMETLTEMFLSDLLKPNQKLRSFHQRALAKLNDISSGNAITRRKYLSYWYFEDQLKELYTTFVLALNKVAHDTVDANKEKAISCMYRLLSGHPEQEKNLLAYIINKLGDPSQKVASKAIYCLGQLLYKHPNMQEVVLLEVEKLLFRPQQKQRAQYYGLCFLSQFCLNHESTNVAKKLIEVYFAFFNLCVKNGDVDSRMMSALLMGVNRAYPYAKLEMSSISGHIDTMYRVVHIASFNVALHTLTLLYQVSDCANNVNDRFYSALYKKLLDPKINVSSHQAMLLNLVYKALSRDDQPKRVIAFVKRLLQLALMMQPAFSCGILYLISQLLTKKTDLLLLQLHEQDITPLNKFEDEGDERYVDVNESVIKIEDDDGETSTTDKDNKNTSNNNSLNGLNENVVEEKDTKDVTEDNEDVKPDINELNEKLGVAGAGWLHRHGSVKQEKDLNVYSPMTRNPLYAGAEFSAYGELLDLQNHYHPSVALFASKIANGESITYSGDSLSDFTLIRFLDRFVFKNPKTLEDGKQGAHPMFGKRKAYKPRGLRSVAVNSERYLNQSEEKIPIDELFVYKFLQNRREVRHIKDSDDDASDVDSVASDEFEEMLEKMHGHKELDEDIDFMNDIGDNLRKDKASKKRKNRQDDDDDGVSSNDEDADLDEEEEYMNRETDEDLSEEDENLSENDDFEKDGENDDLMMDGDEDLIGDDDDDDLSDMVFDTDDENDVDGRNSKQKTKKKYGKKSGDLNSVFASAEEFASLLEDEGSSAKAPGRGSTLANKEKADQEQLAWEEKRNTWLHGYKKAVGGKSKMDFRSKGNKRSFPTKGSFNNKNKKQKFKRY